MNISVKRRSVAVVLLALSLTAAAGPNGKPEDVGLSSERLQRINDVIKRYIDAGQISGAVTMVARKGKVAHFEAQGLMDIEAKTPMRKDAIFRMASMSKPVTGVAILMLIEEGQAPAHRSGVALHSGVQESEGRDGEARGAGRGAAAPAAAAQRAADAGDLHRAGRARDHVRDLLTHTIGPRERRRRLARRRRASRRATPAATSRRTCRSSAPCRSTSSPARSGGTARWPASKRSAASSRSRRGMTFDQFLQAAHLRSARHEGHGLRLPPTISMPRVVTLYERKPHGPRARTDTPALAATEDALLRRRRTVVDAGGLPAVRADAGRTAAS